MDDYNARQAAAAAAREAEAAAPRAPFPGIRPCDPFPYEAPQHMLEMFRSRQRVGMAKLGISSMYGKDYGPPPSGLNPDGSIPDNATLQGRMGIPLIREQMSYGSSA